MISAKDIYTALESARDIAQERWRNVQLRKSIEDELGADIWPEFQEGPRSLLWRPIISPDNGFQFFLHCAHYLNTRPIAFELLQDMFVAVNDEKRGLARLRVVDPAGTMRSLQLVDFPDSEKKKVSEVRTTTNELLVDFHHGLMNESGYRIPTKDMSEWVKSRGGPEAWYYQYLLHFVAHGVLFEYYPIEENTRESEFFNRVVEPALTKIKSRFNLTPLIVKLYPDHQTNEEDAYWWSFPPQINQAILAYAAKHAIQLK